MSLGGQVFTDGPVTVSFIADGTVIRGMVAVGYDPPEKILWMGVHGSIDASRESARTFLRSSSLPAALLIDALSPVVRE